MTVNHIGTIQFNGLTVRSLKCEYNRHTIPSHVSILLECHHQGVLVSVKVVSFELVRNVMHSHSLAHIKIWTP